jgi:hypothetical protein
MLKMLDKPLGLLISVAGGIAAGAVFNRCLDVDHRSGRRTGWPPTRTAAGGRSLSPPAYRRRVRTGQSRGHRGGTAGFRKSPGHGPTNDPVSPLGRRNPLTGVRPIPVTDQQSQL